MQEVNIEINTLTDAQLRLSRNGIRGFRNLIRGTGENADLGCFSNCVDVKIPTECIPESIRLDQYHGERNRHLVGTDRGE